MINQICAEIQKDVWIMEPRMLAVLYEKLSSMTTESLEAISAIKIQTNKPAAMTVNGGVATINIHGVLMKNPPSWLAWFGIGSTAYGQIRQQLSEAIGDPSVKSIRLHIDSPGGKVAGGSETADAIRDANKIKPVSAYIEDLGASGAYWLASQTGQITANLNAEIGSIGVFTVFGDYSKMAEMEGVKIHVVRSGEHKGMGVVGAPITENQIAAWQDVVDGIADNFINAVSTGRRMSAETVRGLADGRVFLAKTAKKNGLIDSIINPDKINVKESNAMAETKTKDDVAADDVVEDTTTAGVDLEAAKKQADDEGKERLGLLEAAFEGEPKFVLEQFKAGATADQAKAAFCDVLTAKLEAADAKVAELEKKKTTVGGDPVNNENDGGGGSQASAFMAAVRQYAKDNKCTQTVALKAVKKESPQLFEDYQAGLTS